MTHNSADCFSCAFWVLWDLRYHILMEVWTMNLYTVEVYDVENGFTM